MATLSLGMIKMVVNYAAIEQKEDWTDYTYSIRLFVKDFPLFSEQIENEMLTKGGLIITTSDDGDRLLDVFKKITNEDTPIGAEELFCSEVDSPQLILIQAYKKPFPNTNNKILQYGIKIELESETFYNKTSTGKITLETMSFKTDEMLNFVKEMEAEKAQILTGKQ